VALVLFALRWRRERGVGVLYVSWGSGYLLSAVGIIHGEGLVFFFFGGGVLSS
jgi:hypothetical protein